MEVTSGICSLFMFSSKAWCFVKSMRVVEAAMPKLHDDFRWLGEDS